MGGGWRRLAFGGWRLVAVGGPWGLSLTKKIGALPATDGPTRYTAVHQGDNDGAQQPMPSVPVCACVCACDAHSFQPKQ